MRVSIQSRWGKRSPSSRLLFSPVGRRPTNTVLTAAPAPIFARTTCAPRGVHSLPLCSPAPFFAVDTATSITSAPSSLFRWRCSALLLSMRVRSFTRSSSVVRRRHALPAHAPHRDQAIIIAVCRERITGEVAPRNEHMILVPERHVRQLRQEIRQQFLFFRCLFCLCVGGVGWFVF